MGEFLEAADPDFWDASPENAAKVMRLRYDIMQRSGRLIRQTYDLELPD